ncbi:hypothetical protein BJY01DRAFT_256609 [Aspergillus pseudoustus]|uniref:Uncharacterized protein n=1 Tax=Aspergillus pseudoustus TaxID=1810923 RepID=A0ABR4I707_9EURO
MWTGRGAPGHGPVSWPWPLTSADDQLGEIPQADPDQGGMTGGFPPAPGLGLGFEVEAGVEPGGGMMLHDHVQRMVRGFMIRGSHGPMQTLLDWRMYGLKVHYNSTALGHVGWIGDNKLLYKEVHFSMGAFRGFVHGLVGSARELLREILYISPLDNITSTTSTTAIIGQFPAIPWSGLYDDPTQGKQGWCFLQDSRTWWPVDGWQWLIQRLRREPALQRQFIRRGQMRAQLVA